MRGPCLALALLLAVACGADKKPTKAKEPAPSPISENRAPSADAGDDRLVAVGDLVELDGRASRDPDGDSLRFSWTFKSRPEGSEAALENASGRSPRFLADAAGLYVIELKVFDGALEAEARVEIRANRPPVADAGGDRSVVIGEAIELDGSGSFDDDGDELSFRWTLLSAPEESEATLGRRSEAKARLTPDMLGSFLIELVVSDGHLAASARILVAVQELPGFSGSVIHVAPSGSDLAVGLQTEPLATIGEALARMQENLAIKRIQLAPGTYEDEAFDYALEKDVEILGPEGEGETAILRGSGNLFSLSGDARLSLHDLRLETLGKAIAAEGSGTSISLNRVFCEAEICVESGRPLAASGGRVSVRSSSLQGPSTDESIGISVANSTEVIVLESWIGGFDAGVAVAGAPLLLRGGDLLGNRIGVSISFNAADQRVEIDRSDILEGETGIFATFSQGITVRDTSLDDLVNGIELSGSGATLTGLQVGYIHGRGLVIGRGLFGGGEVVVLRRSSFSSIAGPAVWIEGSDSSLDMGNHSEPGGNSLHSSHNAIHDARPAGATGIISISGSTVQGTQPVAGQITGPISNAQFRILNARNWIVVY